MANTKDAYVKWKEQGLLDAKLKIISDYYSYKEARGLIYNLLGVSEATWERLKKRHEEIRFTIAEAKKLHEQLLLVSITRRAEGEYYEDTQTIIEESNGKKELICDIAKTEEEIILPLCLEHDKIRGVYCFRSSDQNWWIKIIIIEPIVLFSLFLDGTYDELDDVDKKTNWSYNSEKQGQH